LWAFTQSNATGDHEVRRKLHLRGAQRETAYALAERGDVEVDEQTDWISADLEIGQHLSLMNWLEVLDRLQLDDDCFLDEDVDSICPIDSCAFVVEADLDLSSEAKSA
jgi:hypothetical protein